MNPGTAILATFELSVGMIALALAAGAGLAAGFARRRRRALAATVATLTLTVGIGLAVGGDYRPTLIATALVLFPYGVVVDGRGHRLAGITALALSLFALVLGVIH